MPLRNKLFVYPALAMALAIGGGRVDPSAGQLATVPQIGAWGFDVAGVDPQAKPGDSFSDYANGAWDARTVIPPDKTRFGAFDALRDRTEDQVHAIISDAAKSGASPVQTALRSVMTTQSEDRRRGAHPNSEQAHT